MLELANAIAGFVRMSNKQLTVKVGRIERSNAQVTVQGEIEVIVTVRWVKGGARVNHRHFEKDGGAFDLAEVFEYIATVLEQRKKDAERRAQVKSLEEIGAYYRDVCRNDKRVRVAVENWNEEKPFFVSFRTGDQTALALVVDFLLGFGEEHEVQPRPTPADMRFAVRPAGSPYARLGGKDYHTVRELASLDVVTDDAFEACLKLNVGSYHTLSCGTTVTRTA